MVKILTVFDFCDTLKARSGEVLFKVVKYQLFSIEN